MVGCREHLIFEQRGEELFVFQAQCQCWHCQNCAPWLSHRLAERIKSGNPNAFLTLTYRASREGSPDEHARELVKAFSALRKRINRKLAPKTIAFAAVIERTKRGEPHLHLALRSPFISQAWLSDQMRELIDSPIVHIEKISTTAKAAHYMTKYMTKSPHRFDGCKRYWFSKDYEPQSENENAKRTTPDASGQWTKTTLAQVREAAVILGITIKQQTKTRLVLCTDKREQLRRYMDMLATPRAPPCLGHLAAPLDYKG